MQRLARTLVVSIVVALLGSASCSALTSVTPDEVTTWTRYIVPLPKQIDIIGKVPVQCAKVSIVLPASTDIKLPQARKELRVALGLPETGDNPANPDFTITMQLGGPESDGLASLANSDQSYKILVEPGDAGLRLVALDPYGLYYAAKTLQLMLIPKVSGGSVQMPIVQILDWPDMRDRGLWGCDHFAWLRWMADRKMNIGEQISTYSVSSDRVGHSGLQPGRETMVTEGPYYGIRPAPVVLHLEQVYNTGLFEYLPEVIGVGGRYGCICYSNGAFTNILADWIVDLASLPFVEGIDVWMAENLRGLGGCQCAQCSLFDRNLLETQIILEAWELAKARLGRYFNLWILTSEETYASNTAIFNSLPSDVRIWYYHSLYTYTSGKTPMIPTNIQDVVNSGRYAGVCPSLSVIGFSQPFQSAEFVKYRMAEFVGKNLTGLLGYATPPPLVNYVGYNVEAAAEWTWNVSGRSTHEFAVSYAVRKGLADPEKFAEWADAVGTLEFDLYGSDWPAGEGKYFPGYVADCLRKGTLPALGEAYPGFRGPWGQFENAQQLDNDVALAAKALSLAKEMGIDEYYYESVYANGLITALRALYKLKGLVVGGTVSEANRETARYWFGVYINSLKQSSEALRQWAIVVDDEQDPLWVASTLRILQQCIDGDGGSNPGMLPVATGCGCAPTLPYNSEPAVTIADAKRLGVGAIVNLYGDLVTGGYGTTKFIQERDRSSAIRIRTSTSLTISAPAMVFGTVENSNGELVVNADVVQNAGSVERVAPVAMPLRSLGGGAFGEQPAVMEYRPAGQLGVMGGLNNLGLFVRVMGMVTYVGSDYFYIDDGSRCDDGSGNSGVRVICADGTWSKPGVGDYTTVNGMSSAYFERGNTWRALFVTSPSSIAIIPVPVEIIMDEDQAALTDAWIYATAASGAAYNDDYDYATTAATQNATARWTPNIPRAGGYDVYVMYAEGTDRTVAAPYTVHYDGGSQTYAVNQTSGGGTWQLLGRVYFSAGTTGYVELSNATADPGKVIVADAVKFVRASEGTPPSITTQPSNKAVCTGTTTSFTVSASGSAPLAYQWRKGSVTVSDGGHYSGAATPTLTVSDCDLTDAAADYNCLVTNLYGNVASSNALLLVGDAQSVPTTLPATNVGNNTITWNWSSVAGATSYKLWTASSGGTQIGGTITSTYYVESGLDPGKSYTRYVEAWSGCGAAVTRTQLGPTSTAPRYCVENGDFEGGFTGGIANHWIKMSDDGTSVFAQSTSIKRGGTSSQKIVDPVNGQAYTGWLYQKLNVQPSRQYVLRYYSYRAGASGETQGFVTGLGCDVNGGTSLTGIGETNAPFNSWVFRQSNPFTSGTSGVVTIGFRGGYNHSDSAGYADDIALAPAAPTSTGGTTTISSGQSATITASGGFGGSNSELHWYTGAGGTGTHVGTGTSLVVSPTVTTIYYPRWESYLCPGNTAPSSDGTAVTVTVN